MYLADCLAHTNRWRRRHVAEKLALAGGMLLLSLLLPPVPGGLLISGVMASAALLGAGIPVRAYLRVLAAPLGFLLAGSASLLVSLVPAPGGGWQFLLSPEGTATATAVLCRSLAGVSCLTFLILTVPMGDLLPLAQRVRSLRPVTEVALLIYRFLFLFDRTRQSIWLAQASRLGYGNLRLSYRSLGMLTAALLGRVLDRASRLETGLAARGYGGELRVLPVQRPLSAPAFAAIAALELAVAFLSLVLNGGWR